jgi:hypothetical protein
VSKGIPSPKHRQEFQPGKGLLALCGWAQSIAIVPILLQMPPRPTLALWDLQKVNCNRVLQDIFLFL